MNTAIPTPFDIIDPAPGALVPPGTWWILLLLGAVIAFLLTSLLSRRVRAHSLNSLVAALFQELRTASLKASTPHDFERVARLGRRILAVYLPDDTSGLSSVEMRALAETLRHRDDELHSCTSKALSSLAEVEDRAYAPAHTFEQNDDSKAALQNLVERLEDLTRRPRPR